MANLLVEHRIGASILMLVFGILVLLTSLIFNWKHARYSAEQNVAKEKTYEFLKTSAFQLGLLFAGAGASISTYFFQQSYQREYDEELKKKEALATLALRISIMTRQYVQNIQPFDEFLDDGKPFVGVAKIDNWNQTLKDILLGSEKTLAAKLGALFYIKLDISLDGIESAFSLTKDFERAPYLARVASPQLIAAISDDETMLNARLKKFVTEYLSMEKETEFPKVIDDVVAKNNARYKVTMSELVQDLDILRRSAVRQIARYCALNHYLQFQLSNETILIRLQFETEEETYRDWIIKNKGFLGEFRFGSKTCWEILEYEESKGSAEEPIQEVKTPPKNDKKKRKK